MVKKVTLGTKICQALIWLVVILMTLSCLLPLINMVAISLSSSNAVASNTVGLLPVELTFSTYEKLLNDSQFWASFWISVQRVVLGTIINMFFVITMAYPLSKSRLRFPAREIYIKIVIFAMLFSGGVIPLFMVVSKLNMINTIWALVLPGAVPVFNVILMVNFFKGVPVSLDEAASIDGASNTRQFLTITIPLLGPVLQMVLMNAILGSLKVTDLVLTLTNGKPSGKTEVMMTYIYKKFFGDGGASGLDFGYGAALTVVTAVILGIVTLIYLRATKKSSDVY